MNALSVNDCPGDTVADTRRQAISDKTISMVESLFADYSGFRKSDVLRRKIKRVIDGKSDEEILGWINEMISSRNDYELAALSEDLTNNETFFFRDFSQFECLDQHLLPQLLKQKRKSHDRVIRLWSAACSTGEEAYSLAIIAFEFMLREKLARISDSGRIQFIDGWAIKVFGTDISRQVVKLAQNGIYTNAGLSPFRSFPQRYYSYFERRERGKDRLYNGEFDTYQVKQGIRDLVYFDRHNLKSNGLPLYLKNMDVIFCRNMMIYIEPEAQKAIQQKFAEALAPRGFLMMSVVDKLHDARGFSELQPGGCSVYQRR